MKVKKSLMTTGAVFILGLSASIVSSNKVFAVEVGNTETIIFNVKSNTLAFNQEQLVLESKVHRLAHTGYWGGGSSGPAYVPDNSFSKIFKKYQKYYPSRER
ncbi:hypothetical protein [Lactobacillus taiwanensis]|uniref:hypothetical protein n=1 Tax=Lactobacillus taiwanensis TaxID=508451 RepID=UPI00272DB843|nr:hypothetical protein [Lactobacillus taiwanensis]